MKRATPTVRTTRWAGALVALLLTSTASTRTATAVVDASADALSRASRAEEQGRLDAAAAAYRRVLARDPAHPVALANLSALATRRPLPRESDAYFSTRAILPRGFVEHETSRFVVLSDADADWTQGQAARLERTHHQLRRFFRRMGIEPWPLDHKLVCVLFEEREAYQRFAEKHDKVQDGWVAGYYAPTSDRIVFYRGDDNPSVVDARMRLREMEMEIDDIANEARAADRDGDFARAEHLRAHRQRYREHVDTEHARVQAFVHQVAVATTVHEAVHQIMFHTGLQSRKVAYPVWIAEGLATAFETDSTNGAFGPEHEHAPRRETFQALHDAGKLLPLRDLVTITELEGAPEDLVNVVYHQSYALITWLARARRHELSGYIDRLRRLSGGKKHDARDWIALFEHSFGNLEQLDNAWRRHERTR